MRGRRLGDAASSAGFALVLAEGPLPSCPYRRIRWPDFWVPTDTGERVEVACRGGVGRTGTALAALAVLDGLVPADAVHWVRADYHRRAVETPWQRRWLRRVR